MDPNPPLKQLEGIEYLVGKDWVDLAKVDWKSRGVDPETTVVFIDDHQSAYRRALLALKPQGFRRFMIDDNYPFGTGDNMSFKWTCELLLTSSPSSSLLRNSAPAAWPGAVPDNFNRQKIPVSWEQHLRHAHYLPIVLQTYYEFPPVAASRLSGQTRFNPEITSTPIVIDDGYFNASGLSALDRDEFGGYTHFAYLELKPNVVEPAPALGS